MQIMNSSINTKDLIIQELEKASEPLLNEILDFVRFIKVKQIQEAVENQQDLDDSHEALKVYIVYERVTTESFMKYKIKFR